MSDASIPWYRKQISVGLALLAGVLALALQHILTLWTTTWGGDSQIVSHVSFAGTLVSIILAVLAIVYSYYQNFSQQRDSSSISTQIETLRTVVEDIRRSGTGVSVELNRLEDITKKLDHTILLGEESRRVVHEMHEQVASIKQISEVQAAISSSGHSEAPIEAGRLGERVANVASQMELSCYLALCRGVKLGIDARTIAENVVIPAAHARGYDYLSEWADGIFTGICWTLQSFDLVDTDDSLKITRVDALFEQTVEMRTSQAKDKATLVLGTRSIIDALEQYKIRR